jgi:hypothetical protein
MYCAIVREAANLSDHFDLFIGRVNNLDPTQLHEVFHGCPAFHVLLTGRAIARDAVLQTVAMDKKKLKRKKRKRITTSYLLLDMILLPQDETHSRPPVSTPLPTI